MNTSPASAESNQFESIPTPSRKVSVVVDQSGHIQTAPFFVRAIKPLVILSGCYLALLFVFAKLTGMHYGRWTYTIYWVPAYMITFWIIYIVHWVRREFKLPKRLYGLLAICYALFLAIGLGYDWLMIFAGTWYFDERSILGIYLLQGNDIFGQPAAVPLEEFVFDLTFLPFGFLVVMWSLFKMYNITLVLQPGVLHFKALFTYRGLKQTTFFSIVEVQDLDSFVAAYDPRDAKRYVKLIKKKFIVVKGICFSRLVSLPL